MDVVSDDLVLGLARRAGQHDLAAAERLVSILRREHEDLDRPKLDPNMRLGDVPFEKFGISPSWWGRVIGYAINENTKGTGMWGETHTLRNGSRFLRTSRSERREAGESLKLRDLARPFRKAPWIINTLHTKVDQLLRAAGL
jgi:hypothetical protein